MNRLTSYIVLIAALITAAACSTDNRGTISEERPVGRINPTSPGILTPIKDNKMAPESLELISGPQEPTKARDTGAAYYIPGYRPDHERPLSITNRHRIGRIPIYEIKSGSRGFGFLFNPKPSLEPIILSRETLLVLGFDNDIWDNTDYYYTNGIRAGLYHPDIRFSPFTRFLLPDLRKGVNYYGLIIVHEMFTPIDPDRPEIQFGDRPFSSTLYISHRKTSILPEQGIRLSSALDLGVIGGVALGGFVQRFIHKIEPNGWDNQVRNDAVLNYNVRLDKSLVRGRLGEAAAMVDVQAGTLRTRLSGGISARVGNFASQFVSLSQTTPGHGFFSGRLRYYFEAGAEARLVGYDATLQGGVFNSSNVYTLASPQVERMVYMAHAGFGIGLGRISLEATQVLLSPEFSGGKRHLWVGLSSIISL